MEAFWPLQKPRPLPHRQTDSSSKEAIPATDDKVYDPTPSPRRSSTRLLKRLSLPLGAASATVAASGLISEVKESHSQSISEALPASRKNSIAPTLPSIEISSALQDDFLADCNKVGKGRGKQLTPSTPRLSAIPPTPPSGSPTSKPIRIPLTSLDDAACDTPSPRSSPYSTFNSFPSRTRKPRPPPLPLSPNPPHRRPSLSSSTGSGILQTSQYYILPRSEGSDLGSPASSLGPTTPTTSTPATSVATRRSASFSIPRKPPASHSPSGSPRLRQFHTKHSAGSSLTRFHKLRYHQLQQWEQPSSIPRPPKAKGHQGTNSHASAVVPHSPPRAKSLSERVKRVEDRVMALHVHAGLAPAAQIAAGGGGAVPNNSPQALYQHIVETTSKRISTLDYLRKSFVLHSLEPAFILT
jgi:hypothetical protein